MKIALQRGCAAAQHHIVHPVILQIAERRRIAVSPRKEMLIDAQHGWTQRTGSFRSQSLRHVREPTLHGRAPNSFTLPKPSPADAIPVPEKDHPPEPFTGALPLQDSWELLAESVATDQAQPLPRFQDQPAMPHSPRLMPHSAQIPAFAPQLLTLTIRAGDRSQVSCRNPHHSTTVLDAGHLIVRQP